MLYLFLLRGPKINRTLGINLKKALGVTVLGWLWSLSWLHSFHRLVMEGN